MVLIIATIFSITSRITCGWDHDQSYLTLLPVKLSQGSVLLKDLWDLHQMGAVIPALFCRAFFAFNEDYEGIAIYLRVVSLIVQFTISAFTYIVLKKYYGFCPGFLAAIVTMNMLPRASQQLEYGCVAVWAILVTDLFLLDVYKCNEETDAYKVIIAGLFYALAVFSYPTMALTVPFYYFVMAFMFPSKAKSRVLNCLLFFGVCGLAVLVLIAYELSYMGLGQFVDVIKAISSNGDHAVLFAAFHHVDSWIKSLIRLVLMIGMAIFFSYIVRGLWHKDIHPLFYYLIEVTVVVIGLNISGFRPSGPFGLLERYIGAVILACDIVIKRSDSLIRILFYLFGIVVYFGSLMGSNLGFNENAMYLEISVIAFVVIISYFLKSEQMNAVFERFALILFVFGIVFSSGYFVRVNLTKPASFRDCTEVMDDGPLKGIRVTKDYKDEIQKGSEIISKLSEEDKTYAVLGSEAIYNFYVNGKTVAPGYAPTTNHSQQWIDYYDRFGNELPDVLFLSTDWYPNLQEFYGTPFGDWVKNEYVISLGEYDDVFLMLVRIK